MSEEIFNERLLDKKIEDVVERVLSQRQANPSPTMPPREALDETTIERIKQFNLVSNKPYLTKKELAIYLDVSERSIGEWTARAVEQNPLPVSNAGGEPRFKRERVDEWAEREAQRRR
ncbi:MAG TPA: helix-turn-helix domain-containing protein, partial [Pyrinomonadaceae bacterium]|nr:helix-turn-helix domain-containing protein [Pyrinomonadaceae bacterium]